LNTIEKRERERESTEGKEHQKKISPFTIEKEGRKEGRKEGQEGQGKLSPRDKIDIIHLFSFVLMSAP
jgi:hypothetical protein